MTFSIVATDGVDVGVAVASKFVAVGAFVPHAEASVGAVATQCYANPSLGRIILSAMKGGSIAEEAVRRALAPDPDREQRQIGAVDIRGNAYAFTGRACPEYAGHVVGSGYAAQGNILAGPEVVEAMAKAFEAQRGELLDKLLAALEAGEKAGGDRRGKQSAALVVLRPRGGYLGLTDVYVDIRVDDHPEPVAELRRIFRIWELTLLQRDDPTDVVSKKDVAGEVQEALRRLGFYRKEPTGVWDEETEAAFREWAGFENFENKIRDDDKIWGSVYRYLLERGRQVHR
ncbi:hypothetical protein Pogu_1305 [Pyrobaculum oguniense TE7]|uniref:Putative peptidoglycan binding domain-containing protein n=1 Tax=Pyrobaculum oguniense (strain DSM 13380 / JCM 10595 / TE7) TaxID=698757 RepID=H6QAD1_PYROT|nr:hypothetical protein Pogu_1305 [Pyrobaculum oguniense TE7]